MPFDGCIYARRVRRTSCSSLHTYTKWKNKTGRIFNLKLISLIDIRKPSANAAPALFPRSANYPAGGPIYRREFTQDKHAPGRARLIKAKGLATKNSLRFTPKKALFSLFLRYDFRALWKNFTKKGVDRKISERNSKHTKKVKRGKNLRKDDKMSKNSKK
jgi:hypothetical protein